MFSLAELKDTIRIAPEQFNLKLVEAIRDEINRKLANKVNRRASNELPQTIIKHGYAFLGFVKCRPVHSP